MAAVPDSLTFTAIFQYGGRAVILKFLNFLIGRLNMATSAEFLKFKLLLT
jgi:hypothetical protein